MPFSTYAELQASIAGFLNRDDLADIAVDFIALAESQMQRKVKHWRSEKRCEADITERYVTLPDDFRQPIRLYVTGSNRALDLITSAQMQDKRYSTNDQTGTPCNYCLTAGEIELFPTPSSGTLSMTYRAAIPALSDTNTSNWLLEVAPDAYLYGSLLQSAPYLQADERLPTWTALYGEAIDGLNEASRDAKFGDQRLVAR